MSLKTVDGPLQAWRFFWQWQLHYLSQTWWSTECNCKSYFYVKIKAKEKLLSTGQWTSIKKVLQIGQKIKLFILNGHKAWLNWSSSIRLYYPMHQQRFLWKETFNNSGIIRLNSIDDQLCILNIRLLHKPITMKLFSILLLAVNHRSKSMQ